MRRISMKALISIMILAAVAVSAQVVDVVPRQLAPRTFSALTPANGTTLYCSDCAKTSPCAGSGSGAMAKRKNGAWNCGFSKSGSTSEVVTQSGANGRRSG